MPCFSLQFMWNKSNGVNFSSSSFQFDSQCNIHFKPTLMYIFLSPSICQHLNTAACRAHFPFLFCFIDYIPHDCPLSTSTSKHQVAACVILPIRYLYILSGCCPHPDLFLLSSFSFPPSIFSLFTATLLLTPQLHPCPALLLSISSPFFPLSLHHPCLSFRAEAAPVKLILPLCWGAPSTHRLGFPLTLSLWPSVFLSFSLTVTSTFLSHPGVPSVSHLSSSPLLLLCYAAVFLWHVPSVPISVYPQLFVSHSRGKLVLRKQVQLHDSDNTVPYTIHNSVFECVYEKKRPREIEKMCLCKDTYLIKCKACSELNCVIYYLIFYIYVYNRVCFIYCSGCAPVYYNMCIILYVCFLTHLHYCVTDHVCAHECGFDSWPVITQSVLYSQTMSLPDV